LFDWRWLFAFNLPILIVVLIMAPPLLPNARPDTRLPFDWLGMFCLGLMLAMLTYGLNHIDTANFWTSLASSQVWPFIALAVGLLPIFLWVEQQAADPIIHLRLFKSRQLSLASLLALGAGVGESAVVFIPSLVVAAFGVSKSTASFLLTPLVLALAVGAPLVGRLLDKIGSKWVIISGTALLSMGMLSLSLVALNWILFVTATILIGLGLLALLGAPLRYIMLNEAPTEDRAVAQALITIFTGIGQLVSGALVGAIVASAGGGVAGYSAAYGVIGIAAIGMMLFSFGLKSRATELATIAENKSVQVAGAKQHQII
jgi:MFS family permease